MLRPIHPRQQMIYRLRLRLRLGWVSLRFVKVGNNAVSAFRCSASVIYFLLATLFLSQMAQAQSTAEDAYIPNLVNVDIHNLIETVSQRTGKNFIVDPRVNAKVTVVSSESMDAEELYDLFLSILDVHGFAAVPAGGFIKIVPAAIGVQSAVPVLRERGVARGIASDELVTEIIPVKHVPVQQLVDALRALLPATSSINAETHSNTLVLTGRAANIARLVEIVQSLDSLN